MKMNVEDTRPQDGEQRHSDVLNDDWDGDSALGSEYGDSMQSLTSSVLNYTYENGRRYHAFREGQYFMPNDDQEQEAMDLMHHVSRMILKGELYRAPLSEPKNILDIGTGTGIWAIDVADVFPAANVIATDLSPIQPSWVPPNLQFEVDDCESEWSFGRKFDFIHMRNMAGSIADWPKLFKTCYDHLDSGGYIEMANIEVYFRSHGNVIDEDCAAYAWQRDLRAASIAVGRDLNVVSATEEWLLAAGFVDVHDDSHMIPASQWTYDASSNELAMYFQALVGIELEALSLRLYTTVLGWSLEKLQALLAAVQREARDPRNRMFAMMHYTVGRKP